MVVEATSKEARINPTSIVVINIIYKLIKEIPKFASSGFPVLRVPNIMGGELELPVPRVNIYLDKRLISDTGKGGALRQRTHNQMEVHIDVVSQMDEHLAKERSLHTWEQLIENQMIDNYQIHDDHRLASLIPDSMTFHWMKIAEIDYVPGIDEFERLVDELQFKIIVAYDRKRD